jgi:hypothetical protein
MEDCRLRYEHAASRQQCLLAGAGGGVEKMARSRFIKAM